VVASITSYPDDEHQAKTTLYNAMARYQISASIRMSGRPDEDDEYGAPYDFEPIF